MNALKKESEAEAALAAAKVLEAAAEAEHCKSEMDIASPSLSPAVSRQHTDEYINAHFNHQQDDKSENKVEVACISQPQYTEALYTSQRMLQPVSGHTLQHFQDPQTTHQSPHSNVKAFSPYSPHESNKASFPHKVNEKPTTLRSTDVVVTFSSQGSMCLMISQIIICHGDQPSAMP